MRSMVRGSGGEPVTSRYPRVASPLRVGDVTLPNRIVRTAHLTGFAIGRVTDKLIAYHEARARGGVGLHILEIAAVHPSAPAPLPAWDDSVVAGFAALAERIHAHGSAVFAQLWHGGVHARPLDGSAPWSASEVPGPVDGAVPVAMTLAQIDELVDAFGAAAARARAGGLDGVEIHGAHGYLVGQFLSPLTNRRTDDYGGSVQARLRFPERILEAVRSAVGSGYPVGIRLSASEAVEGGLGVDDTTLVAKELEGRGLVDFVDLSLGGYYSFPKMVGAMHEDHGYQLPTSEPVARALCVPTIVTGRITSLAEAEAILASGAADLVSMVRATIADPDLVAKSLAGREAEVRPCIGCNIGCVGGLFGSAGRMGCTVNPDVGSEHKARPPSPADRPRRVLVVGAGPAGLEAARTAALRGHEVVVCDAADAPGGQTRSARRAPRRAEFGLVSDWLAAMCGRLGVELRLSAAVDASFVAGGGYDAVVVATGAIARSDGHQRARPGWSIPGVDMSHVRTVEDVLRAEPPPGARRAVVFDDLGTYPALGAAEYLAEAGFEVVLASGLLAPGSELGITGQRDPTLERLGRAGVRFLPRMMLEAILPDVVCLAGLDSGQPMPVEADLVVLATGFVPQRALARDLAGVGVEVRVVGDAVMPRGLQVAIAEGRGAGLAV